MTETQIILSAPTVGALLEKADVYLSANPGMEPVFKRYLLEDPSQRFLLPDEDGAVSYIVQPPLGGMHIALWIYAVAGAERVERSSASCGTDGQFRYTRLFADGLEHIWTAGGVVPGGDSEAQTRGILEGYESFLESEGLTIADNCVRTWFFCHDIDNNYAGLVKARRENFRENGLTENTHYIASTGIFGTPTVPGALVQMDAYAVRGSMPQQYLYAPTHLNPTYEYGVTFERGVKVDYSGKSRCIISGTASIDNRGAVVHVGDVRAQTLRMWENIERLLDEGGCSPADITMALVYLRNPSDYELVAPMFASRFPDLPYVILEAPVCRPDWLVEMECIAVR